MSLPYALVDVVDDVLVLVDDEVLVDVLVLVLVDDVANVDVVVVGLPAPLQSCAQLLKPVPQPAVSLSLMQAKPAGHCASPVHAGPTNGPTTHTGWVDEQWMYAQLCCVTLPTHMPPPQVPQLPVPAVVTQAMPPSLHVVARTKVPPSSSAARQIKVRRKRMSIIS